VPTPGHCICRITLSRFGLDVWLFGSGIHLGTDSAYLWSLPGGRGFDFIHGEGFQLSPSPIHKARFFGAYGGPGFQGFGMIGAPLPPGSIRPKACAWERRASMSVPGTRWTPPTGCTTSSLTARVDRFPGEMRITGPWSPGFAIPSPGGGTTRSPWPRPG
jgi:hypothetical protein